MSSIGMIGLSQTTGYAIQALSCLTDSACQPDSIADIAACSSVPRAYLAKIVQALARREIVHAKRGVGGGIRLARPPEQINLLEIVEAIEGDEWLGGCLLNLKNCASLSACPTSTFWQRIRAEITEELETTTLASVIAHLASTQKRACATRRSCAQRPPRSTIAMITR